MLWALKSPHTMTVAEGLRISALSILDDTASTTEQDEDGEQANPQHIITSLVSLRQDKPYTLLSLSFDNQLPNDISLLIVNLI